MGMKSIIAFQGLSPSHTVGLEHRDIENATYLEVCHHPTRWAWNLQLLLDLWKDIHVTIPHSGLGTTKLTTSQDKHQRLHPTRWARNKRLSKEVITRCVNAIQDQSPSHTVGSEPQTTTLTKIRHINHFVKRAPLSNEVNFPKSEIMQS
jgi:hypothetical protein